jgi:hypothetical protein
VRTAEWKYTRYFVNDRALFAKTTGGGEGGAISDALTATYARWLTSSVKGETPVHEELFDLAQDPNETSNLAREPRHADRLRELQAECQQLVTKLRGDPAIPPATVRLEVPRGAGGKKSSEF